MPLLPAFMRSRLATSAFAAVFCIAAPAWSAPLQEAQQYLRQAQYPQALEQVEKILSEKPKDAQGRFLKGVIYTEMGKTSDAITVFTKLTEDYPELPEPYNNLAVIYAQQKQYEKAKQALEKAIRTHPAYATAHENLGDIYARMAVQAYDKALQLDSSNSAAQTKLAMIRDLISTSSKPGPAGKPVVVATAPITPLPTPTPVKPAEPVKEAPKPVPTPVAAPTPVAVPTPAPVATPAPAATPKPTPAPAEKPAPAAGGSADVLKRVESWADDWSKKDVKGYLSHYARDFKTPGGISRADWETERTQRIRKPGAIKVSVENAKVILDGADQATVHFRQHYVSASLKTGSAKTLVLVKRDGKWLIQQERIGN